MESLALLELSCIAVHMTRNMHELRERLSSTLSRTERKASLVYCKVFLVTFVRTAENFFARFFLCSRAFKDVSSVSHDSLKIGVWVLSWYKRVLQPFIPSKCHCRLLQSRMVTRCRVSATVSGACENFHNLNHNQNLKRNRCFPPLLKYA